MTVYEMNITNRAFWALTDKIAFRTGLPSDEITPNQVILSKPNFLLDKNMTTERLTEIVEAFEKHGYKVPSWRKQLEELKRQSVLIEDMGLEPRACNILKRSAGYQISRDKDRENRSPVHLRAKDVIDYTPSLLRLEHCGIRSVVNIVDTFKKYGIEVPAWERELKEYSQVPFQLKKLKKVREESA